MDRATIISKRINENIENLESYVNQYKILTARVSTSILDKSDENMVFNTIQEIGFKFKQTSNSTKDKIQGLSNLLSLNLNAKEKDVIKWHINAHSRKLISLTNLFRDYNFEFKKNEENRTKFLYRAANLDASDEQINEYLKSPGSNKKISSFFSLGDKSQKLKLNEVIRRQDEIKKINELAKEIEEITLLVTDLIYEHSVTIDTLSDDIMMTEEHLKKSNLELEKTLMYKIRRKKFWRMVLFILFFIVMVYTGYYILKDDWFNLRNRD